MRARYSYAMGNAIVCKQNILWIIPCPKLMGYHQIYHGKYAWNYSLFTI